MDMSKLPSKTLLTHILTVVNMNTTIEETATAIEEPKLHETEEETCCETDGEMAMVLGPKDVMSSGLGGLGLEGMMGSDASVGESSPLLGEGNKGVMSGDEAGE
ncbi:hypothetical protein Hanom_Chr11g01021651 [Helianthus anomalus]